MNNSTKLLNEIFINCKKGKLLKNYENINRDIIIEFSCDDCAKETSKRFERIKKLGPYCKSCIFKKRINKTKETFIEKYGVSNMNELPGMKERIKETKNKKYTKEEQKKFLEKCHEGSKKRWEEYRKKDQPFLESLKKNGKSICKFCNEEKNIDRFQKYSSTYTNQELYDLKCYDCKNKSRIERIENKQLTIPLEDYLEILLKSSNERIKQNKKIKEFSINIEDLKEIWNKQDGKCYYSGRKMKYNFSRKELPKLKSHPEKVSIDRLDSNKGYIKDNIVLCCLMANTMKFDTSLEEFKKWIYDINNTINNHIST
jgi:hypothetical protein